MTLPSKTLLCVHTLLCCGLNLLIPWMKAHPTLAKFVAVALVLNEIRGVVFVWESRGVWLPWIS